MKLKLELRIRGFMYKVLELVLEKVLVGVDVWIFLIFVRFNLFLKHNHTHT